MQSLKHPCIVSLKGFHVTPPMSLCMEYTDGGDLSEAIKTSPSWFNATQKAIIVTEIALGMEYLHSKNAIHRDLKPSNVLLKLWNCSI